MQMTVDSDLSFSHSLKGFVLVLRARGNTWTRIQMMFWSNRTAAASLNSSKHANQFWDFSFLKRNFEGLNIKFWRSIVSEEEESKKKSFETMRHFPHDSCMEFRWLSFPVSLSHSQEKKPSSYVRAVRQFRLHVSIFINTNQTLVESFIFNAEFSGKKTWSMFHLI